MGGSKERARERALVDLFIASGKDEAWGKPWIGYTILAAMTEEVWLQ